MPDPNRNYHRSARLIALSEWAESGILRKRSPLPIERNFLSRVSESEDRFFVPLALGHLDDAEYHKEVSYLIDALDQLPSRPDVAFDSTFKALESTVKRIANTSNVTKALLYIAGQQMPTEACIGELFRNVPVQTCEYLYKRIEEYLDHWPTGQSKDMGRVLWRLHEARNGSLNAFMNALLYRKNQASAGDRRKQAMFIRLALRGETMSGTAHPTFKLDWFARIHLLLSGLLYTARNDRFHGESFSPFVSSAASIKTYTHPHYLFISSYVMMNALWVAETTRNGLFTESDVAINLKTNLISAQNVFGPHWDR